MLSTTSDLMKHPVVQSLSFLAVTQQGACRVIKGWHIFTCLEKLQMLGYSMGKNPSGNSTGKISMCPSPRHSAGIPNMPIQTGPHWRIPATGRGHTPGGRVLELSLVARVNT